MRPPGDPAAARRSHVGPDDRERHGRPRRRRADIGALIADPANAALQDLVVAAIRDRVTYDPVFAAAWVALLGG